MSRIEMKQQAKAAMKTSRPHYALVALIVIVFMIVLNAVYAALAPGEYEMPSPIFSLFGMLLWIVGIMVDTGWKWYGLMLIRGNGQHAGNAFTLSYGCFIIVLVTSVVIGVFATLWTLLLIIPGIIAMYRYRMAMYIIHDDPEVGIMESIRKSKRMMVGHKMDLFVLDLSFIGWGLLCVITLGIACLYVIPYYMTTQAAFYDSIQQPGMEY
ncbi:MAG: DUF975 family protein [Butyricicoccaceae bacterium]